MTTPKPASDASNTPRWYPTIDIDNDPTGTIKAAADHSAALVAEMVAGMPPRWLTIAGKQGNGKTMLARQIFEQAQQINPARAGVWYGPRRRPGCVWWDEVRFAKAVEFDSWLPEYLAADYLVVLDDLGSAREQWDRVADALFRLANARLGKWTVWTTNLTHAEIAAKEPRVASRIIRDGNRAVRINADDYALRSRKQSAP